MSEEGPQTIRGFPATSWTLVRRARESDDVAAGRALDALCRAYWRPLYAHARGAGLASADAQDAVQDFFAAALRRELFQRADEQEGKLRSFLLTAFKRVLIDRAAQAGAARRTPEGGWAEGDFELAEAEWARMAGGGGATPDAVFERQWARELIARATRLTQARYEAEGKSEVFAELRTEALEEGESERKNDGNAQRKRTERQSDRSAKGAEGMTAGARRVAVHRLRKRFGEALRAAVAETLPEGADAEAELRALGATLRRGGE